MQTRQQETTGLISKHLDWTSKQGRIATGQNKANCLYTQERGFPFAHDELPYYHLEQGTTYDAFQSWRDHPEINKTTADGNKTALICGAWQRLLFVGGVEHSTCDEERSWNLQSKTLFIDLRIPITKGAVLPRFTEEKSSITSINQYSLGQLRLFSRQHVFSGFTRIQDCDDTDVTNNGVTGQYRNDGGSSHDKHRQYPIVCTRHHCIDWNFIGMPLPRPNKWYVEPISTTATFSDSRLKDTARNSLVEKKSTMLLPRNEDSRSKDTPRLFKEWSFAIDRHGQSYNFETWKDHSDLNRPSSSLVHNDPVILALRKSPSSLQPFQVTSSNAYREDGVLVVVGNHFNYVHGRRKGWQEAVQQMTKLLMTHTGVSQKPDSLVELVDAALDHGLDRTLLEHLLDVEAGHGLIFQEENNEKPNWKIDCAIQPWREGTMLFDPASQSPKLVVPYKATRLPDGQPLDINGCYILWNQERWDFFECSGVANVNDLAALFGLGAYVMSTTDADRRGYSGRSKL
jgi:hypothetical protein